MFGLNSTRRVCGGTGVLRALAILWAMLGGAPASAGLLIVTQANLAQSLEQAQPGDTLLLLPGGYGVVAFPKKSWPTPITINAQLASVAGVSLVGTSGVTWNGGSIVGSIYAVNIKDSSRITITGADISGAVRGIVIDNSDDVVLTYNHLHNLRTDGIDIIGQRVRVESNIIEDMHPIASDHPDGVQMWSANGEQTREIIVRNNTINGNMQGIFGRSTSEGLAALTVTGNKISTAWGNGVALLNTSDSVATGNSVKPRPESQYKASMRVEGSNNRVCGNTVPDVPDSAAAQPC